MRKPGAGLEAGVTEQCRVGADWRWCGGDGRGGVLERDFRSGTDRFLLETVIGNVTNILRGLLQL